MVVKILMHPIGEAIEFAMAKVSDEMTGLASMLQWFKEEVQLDVTSISLVELTTRISIKKMFRCLSSRWMNKH